MQTQRPEPTTRYDRAIFEARQLYYKFDEWAMCDKPHFKDALAFQLNKLKEIEKNGTPEQRKTATQVKVWYEKFQQSNINQDACSS